MGYGHIDCRFADGIGPRYSKLYFVNEFRGTQSGRQSQDFLRGAFAEKRYEGVYGLNDPDDIGFEAACEIFDQCVWVFWAIVFAPLVCCGSGFNHENMRRLTNLQEI